MTDATAAIGRSQRAYVRHVLAEKHITPTALAKAIGVSPSTLTRFLNEPNESSRTLHAATVEKIAAATGIVAPALEPGQERRVLMFREDAVPYVAAGELALEAAIKALIGARNAADPWLIKSHSLELLGYRPGDIVIVDLGVEPKPGDAVCAQINIDWMRGTAETVMRIFDIAGATRLLFAASLDPAYAKPLPLDDRAAIKGVITHSLRAVTRIG